MCKDVGCIQTHKNIHIHKKDNFQVLKLFYYPVADHVLHNANVQPHAVKTPIKTKKRVACTVIAATSCSFVWLSSFKSNY